MRKTESKTHQDKTDDVSAITINVVEQEERVMLHFDKAATWIGLNPVDAIKVAERMKEIAIGILRSTPRTTNE